MKRGRMEGEKNREDSASRASSFPPTLSPRKYNSKAARNGDERFNSND